MAGAKDFPRNRRCRALFGRENLGPVIPFLTFPIQPKLTAAIFDWADLGFRDVAGEQEARPRFLPFVRMGRISIAEESPHQHSMIQDQAMIPIQIRDMGFPESFPHQAFGKHPRFLVPGMAENEPRIPAILQFDEMTAAAGFAAIVRVQNDDLHPRPFLRARSFRPRRSTRNS